MLHLVHAPFDLAHVVAVVGEGAIVAAGAVVLKNTKIGPHELWAGTPAKFVKMVDPAQASEINVKIARNYLMYSRWYAEPGCEPYQSPLFTD